MTEVTPASHFPGNDVPRILPDLCSPLRARCRPPDDTVRPGLLIMKGHDMRALITRFAPLLVAALAVVSFPVAGPAAAARSAPAGGAPLHTRITGPPIPGASAAAAPGRPPGAAGLPSRQHQITVLTAVLDGMRKHYAKYARYTPGPQDIFDYGIGSLWRQGIDGAGTTVAVIEGWNYKGIAKRVAVLDKIFGLPNPTITTIYPAGKLPARCPPGMVKLGSYGSCSAWAGELTLDVFSAHLIAPYAQILIAVTPADTEVTDDAASQVAPPEMMEALERIASGHLANVISISDSTGESTYSHGPAEITAQDPGELAAAAAGIPVLVATGDCGVVQNLAVATGQCEDTSTGPDTAAWDDSPWVTAVGGSVPNLNSRGKRVGPDPLWRGRGVFSEGPATPRCSRGPPTRTGWRASPAAGRARCRTSRWMPSRGRRRRRRC